MKKTIQILFATIAFVTFYACNNGEEKKAEAKTDVVKTDSTKVNAETAIDSTGIRNLLITNTDAQAMMKRFDRIYKNATPQASAYLSNSEWIDAVIINSYAIFFERPANKNFDGIRFVNGATNNRNKSRILMVPTKPSSDTTKKHENIWGTNITLEDNTDIEYYDYMTTLSKAKELQDNFDSIYRKTEVVPLDKNPLSKSVWMSKSVILYLRDKIKDPKNEIDGIRIYMGAYDKITGNVPGQFHPDQSTILLVPTTRGESKKVHNDRWDILRAKEPIAIRDAVNHGSLCPQICN